MAYIADQIGDSIYDMLAKSFFAEPLVMDGRVYHHGGVFNPLTYQPFMGDHYERILTKKIVDAYRILGRPKRLWAAPFNMEGSMTAQVTENQLRKFMDSPRPPWGDYNENVPAPDGHDPTNPADSTYRPPVLRPGTERTYIQDHGLVDTHQKPAEEVTDE